MAKMCGYLWIFNWDLYYLGASMESSLSRRGLEMFLVGAMFSFSSVMARRKRNTYNMKPMKT